MKKLFCVFLCYLIVMSLSACVRYSDYDNAFSGNLEIKTEFESYDKNTKKIKYTITNVTNQEQCFGVYEYLAKKVDGQWQLVEPKGGSAWDDLGWIIDSGKTYTQTFDLENYYRLPLSPGEYKLVLLDEAESNIFVVE
ncbi:MAG: hypothetical protein J6V50_04925 [Clostridia bacterium]|nr:hypothetical protein [Clostridia bacterium]